MCFRVADVMDQQRALHSGCLVSGVRTPPVRRNSKLASLGRIFKPWKWRKKKNEKLKPSASECRRRDLDLNAGWFCVGGVGREGLSGNIKSEVIFVKRPGPLHIVFICTFFHTFLCCLFSGGEEDSCTTEER